MPRKLDEVYRRSGLEINQDKTEFLTTNQEAVMSLDIGSGRIIRNKQILKAVQQIGTDKEFEVDEVMERIVGEYQWLRGKQQQLTMMM